MGAPETLPDVQGMLADFGFTIDQVGVKSVKFPLQISEIVPKEHTI
jgi:GTP cyclohydrolase I